MKISVLLIAFGLATAVHAQDDGLTDLMASYLAAKLHQDSIDVSNVVVVYNYHCKTLDSEGQPVTDSMQFVLQSGGHCARFYPYHKYLEDTEDATYFTLENYATVQSDAMCHVPEVWTNYPDGMTTVRDIIPPGHYESCEELDRPTWTIRELDTLTINGYRCKTASSKYHGLEWTVRFTEDIPVAAGPWKLNGLPGLILEAESRDGIHRFAMEGLEKVKTPVFYEHNAITKKVADKKLVNQRNKIFGSKLYARNPMYYADVRALTQTEDVIYYENGSGEMSEIINGVFVGKKAHVFQPLEK